MFSDTVKLESIHCVQDKAGKHGKIGNRKRYNTASSVVAPTVVLEKNVHICNVS